MGDLLVLSLKGSWEVSLSDALKAYFKEGGYSSKDTAVVLGLEEFGRFRSQVINKSLPKGYASLELLYRYHDQLASLLERLPRLGGQKGLHNVTVYWDDAVERGGLLMSKSNIASSSLELERLAILFNIAAFQSLVAVDCRAMDTDEELKNAAKLFQSAASILNFLSECKSPVFEGVTLTSDFKPDTLSALSALMLAQAQQVFLEKAIKDRMKDSLIAKLCVQAEDMFADASTKLNKDSVKHLWDRSWLNCVAGKTLGYQALSYYFQSQVCHTNKQFGEQIGRLDFFLKNGKKAQDKVGVSSFLSTLLAEAEIKYRDAKKDNDFIYNEIVPKADDLSPIDNVGSARLAKLGAVPEKFSSHFVDLFSGAVRKGEGDSGEGPTLKSIINTATGQLGQYLVNLAGKSDKK